MYDLTKQTAYVCDLVCACSVPNRSNIIIICSRQNSTYIVAPEKVRFFFFITKTSLFKYTESFTTQKGNFSDKKFDIFHISPHKLDCGYSLEPVLTNTPQSMYWTEIKKCIPL